MSEEAWMPIETAPKDGTWFLGFTNDRDHPQTIAPFQWQADVGEFVDDDDCMAPVSHWMPLPAPPTPKEPRA